MSSVWAECGHYVCHGETECIICANEYLDNHRKQLQEILEEHGICADCGEKHENCEIATEGYCSTIKTLRATVKVLTDELMTFDGELDGMATPYDAKKSIADLTRLL